MTTKILVADDDVEMEALVRQRFRQKIVSGDYHFVFASNGLKALNLLSTSSSGSEEPSAEGPSNHQAIDIILTDINMPEMDGLTLLETLQNQAKQYKTIVISAHDDLANIRQAMNRGAADFITKPIDFKDLETTLEKIIRQAGVMKELQATSEQFLEIEKELALARTIQQTLIPQNFDQVSLNLPVCGIVEPAKEVGGDFFDCFALNDNHMAFFIGDVSGKSISAALFMAMAKTLLRSIANLNLNPRETLDRTNQILGSNNPFCMFVTLFYALLNLETGELIYANAGHPTPYLISKSGHIKELASTVKSPPLGIDQELLKSPQVQSFDRIKLSQGDTLFLYTDGITEAANKNGERYLEKGLLESLKRFGQLPLDELIKNVLEEVHQFSEGTPQTDDIALFTIRYTS